MPWQISQSLRHVETQMILLFLSSESVAVEWQVVDKSILQIDKKICSSSTTSCFGELPKVSYESVQN